MGRALAGNFNYDHIGRDEVNKSWRWCVCRRRVPQFPAEPEQREVREGGSLSEVFNYVSMSRDSAYCIVIYCDYSRQ